MSSKKVTVAVCCYGLMVASLRTEAEMAGLEEYLSGCAEYIARLYHAGNLSGVVLSGGYANPALPTVSEAESSAFYLLEQLHELGVPIDRSHFTLCFETRSRNTPQNIMFTLRTIAYDDPFTADEFVRAVETNPAKAAKMDQHRRDWRNLSHYVVFTCDRPRHLKVWALLWWARMLMSGWHFHLRVKSFLRRDTHPNSTYWRQFLATLRYLPTAKRFFEELHQEPTR